MPHQDVGTKCSCARTALIAVLVVLMGSISLTVEMCSTEIGKEMSLDILIQRHAESMENGLRPHQCKKEELDASLTQKGIDQAKNANRFMMGRMDLRPDFSFSSCLTRAMQTAAITFSQTVHVSDFLPESGFGVESNCGGHNPSCAASPDKQVGFLMNGRNVSGCIAPKTPSVVKLLNWSYMGGRPRSYTNHTFNWSGFLDRLWGDARMKKLISRKEAGQPTLISVTTHSMKMACLFPRRYRFMKMVKIKPKNAAIYQAKLPLLLDKSGSVIGFKKTRPKSVRCLFNCHAPTSEGHGSVFGPWVPMTVATIALILSGWIYVHM